MNIYEFLNSFINNKLITNFRLIGAISISFTAFSQAPSLGLCSSFALFTANGAISNVGTTQVVGDIGTNVGAFTGFPPGLIIGQTNIADGTSAQAAIDVAVAYNFVDALTCDSVIGVLIGGSQTLTPNKYCIGAAASLNGDLILDGQGNPNSIFIFKINGAFSAAASSNIVLTNSAQINNVYWQVNGLLSLGNYSIFKGILLVNGAINLLDSSNFYGQVLSKVGAITLSNNNIVLSNNVLLPIELVNFRAVCENNNAMLNWSTASENNNDYFNVERSFDAMNWMNIGGIIGAGNSIQMMDYDFMDTAQLINENYYRIKQTDFDGKFKYSVVVNLSGCGDISENYFISPNPNEGKFRLMPLNETQTNQTFFIINALGKVLYQSGDFEREINLTEMDSGIYFLYLNLTNGKHVTKISIVKL